MLRDAAVQPVQNTSAAFDGTHYQEPESYSGQSAHPSLGDSERRYEPPPCDVSAIEARKRDHDATLLLRDGTGIAGRQLRNAWKEHPIKVQ